MSILERLKELAAKATPGPWEFILTEATEKYQIECEGTYKVQPSGGDEYSYFMCDAKYYNTAPRKHDAQLIAEMRNTLPKLLAVVEAAQLYWNDETKWKELRDALAALEKEDV